MSTTNPPPLVDYQPEDYPTQDFPSKGRLGGRSYFQIVQATASVAVFFSVVSIMASNVFEARQNQVSRSIFELLGGVSIGWFLPSILSKQWGNASKSLISDYATPTFLILSQVFLNLTKGAKTASQPYFFGFFNVYGGMALAAYVHSVISWRLGKGVDHPLDDNSNFMSGYSLSLRADSDESDFSSENPDPADEAPPVSSGNSFQAANSHLKMAIDSSAKRLSFSAVITTVGVAAIFSGIFVEKAKLLRDFGVILSGIGTARIVSELWWKYANRKFSQQRKNLLQVDHPRYSFAIHYYSAINRIILVAFHALPGALIVGAEIAAEKKILPVSIPFFALTGIMIGWNEHLRQTRFSEVSIENLHEVRVSHQRIFPPKSLFGGVKWFVGVPCILTFIGLTMAGYNPDRNVFEKVSPYVISSMTTFAVALYSSYFFAESARVLFSKKPINRMINTAYYSSHYSLGIPLLFLYVTEKLLIDDEAINFDGPYAGTWTTLAWGSLGLALGTEASGRFDFRSPRVVSSLYLALFGKYFANLLSGKA